MELQEEFVLVGVEELFDGLGGPSVAPRILLTLPPPLSRSVQHIINIVKRQISVLFHVWKPIVYKFLDMLFIVHGVDMNQVDSVFECRACSRIPSMSRSSD